MDEFYDGNVDVRNNCMKEFITIFTDFSLMCGLRSFSADREPDVARFFRLGGPQNVERKFSYRVYFYNVRILTNVTRARLLRWLRNVPQVEVLLSSWW